MRVCIASHHGAQLATFNGLLFEATTALGSMCDSVVLAPPAVPRSHAQGLAQRVVSRLSGRPPFSAQPEPVPEPCDLFLYLCMTIWDLANLQAFTGWRERAKKAAVFVYEAWSGEVDLAAKYIRLLDQVDHVFLFSPNSIPAVQRHTSAPVSYLPAGVDCLRATPLPRPARRPIDVYGMGRMDQTAHAQLLELTRRQELFYVWDPHGSPVTMDTYGAARDKTYHMIRSSRLFACFNFAAKSFKSGQTRGEEAIPARVFEGAAAGSVLFGTAPPLREFEELFDWEDALVEIPMDPVDVPGIYAELQRQPDRVQRAGLLNATQSLRRHDWAYRLEAMLRTLDLPTPAGVVERKAKLVALAAIGEA